MITGIRRRLVDDIRRRAPQLHPLALEPQVAHARDLLVAIPKVLRHEQRQPLDFPELGAFDGELLHLGGLRQLKHLVANTVLGRAEVDVVAVLEYLQGFGC